MEAIIAVVVAVFILNIGPLSTVVSLYLTVFDCQPFYTAGFMDFISVCFCEVNPFSPWSKINKNISK